MRDGLNELQDNDEEAEGAGSDGHVRRLLAGYALGVLDPAESELVARHIGNCRGCQDELANYTATTDMLAYAAAVRQVPLRARAGLLGKLDEIGTTNAEQMIVLRSETDAIPGTQRSRPPKLTLPFPQWSRTRIAAFSAVPLLLLVALVVAMGVRINDQQDELAAIKVEQTETDRFVTNVEQGDPSAVQEVIPSNAAMGAEGKLLIDRETDTALLLVVGLPQPDGDQQYIVWLDFANNSEYAKAGPLAIDPQGRAKLILDPSGSIALYDRVLVTAEIDPDVTSPQGPELMTAEIMPSD